MTNETYEELTHFIDWENLKNPVYDQVNNKDWSVKDACMEYDDISETFYLFFSAFFKDRGILRSHIVGITTKDWIDFSEPFLFLDGKEDGWTGLCSPNITKVQIEGSIGPVYYLSYNSWGKKHPNGRKNSLFFIKSQNLKDWSDPVEIAAEIHPDIQKIDIAIAYTHEKFYVIWKETLKLKRNLFDKIKHLFADLEYKRSERKKTRFTVIGTCKKLGDPIKLIGENGRVSFKLKDGQEARKIQENYQFIEIDEKWYIVSSDYPPKCARLYSLMDRGKKDEDWNAWVEGYDLDIPKEDWNTNHISNAPFIADWRKYDGYIYLLYAGRTENLSHAGRGNNKLGLARTRDLVRWEIP